MSARQHVADDSDHYTGTVYNPQTTHVLFLKTDITVKIHSDFVIEPPDQELCVPKVWAGYLLSIPLRYRLK